MVEARKRILCIDDDQETAALIAEDLVDRGFDVTVAHDGQEGLAAILTTRPDLVVCDVNMPILTGPQVAERLALVAPDLNLPFVFLTAMSDRQPGTAAQKRGFYVTKPIDFDRLSSIIDARLADLVDFDVSVHAMGAPDREVEGAA